MRRPWMMLGWLCLVGCGGRPAAVSDLGGLGGTDQKSSIVDGKPQKDGLPVRDAGLPATCASLGKVGSVVLDFTDTAKSPPRLAFDGERFLAVWHSQPMQVSSLNGELRFALVDRTGKTDTPNGISLGADDGALEPAVAAAAGEYAVVHKPTTMGENSFVLRRFDAKGKILATVPLNRPTIRRAALAPQPSGYAVLLDASYSPEVVIVDRAGTVSAPRTLITAQVISSVWLEARPGGLAAAYSTTNQLAELVLLDESLNSVGQAQVAPTLRSPSFAVLPSGVAALYAKPPQVELALFDGAAKRLGPHPVGTMGVVPTVEAGQTALVWTGQQLVAAYPGAGASQFQIQRLTADGEPVGQAVAVPVCSAVTSCQISAAWGRDRLALGGIVQGSGVPAIGISVTLVGCP